MSKRYLDDARDALRRDDPDAALGVLIAGTETLLETDSPVYRMPIGWRPADALCEQIGERLRAGAEAQPGEPEDLDLYIATQLYAGGGHTAVIGDFVRATGAARSEVLVTGTVDRDVHAKNGGVPAEEVVARLGVPPGSLAVCPDTGLADAARWLIGEIRARRPRRVFLFHHPQDAVAVTAASAADRGELYLVHHADRQPCLGLYQDKGTIIDLSPYTGEFTRRVLNLPTLYAPLIIADPGPPPAREIAPPFTTISTGAPHKFDDSYPDNIARVLGATGGRHIHIGFLKKERIGNITATLDTAGIDPGRFDYIRWVPSLARALIELGADICIGSAPLGGARTAIECCAAGVPMLAHYPPFSTRFGVGHVTPSPWPMWTTTAELIALLEGIDAAWIAAMGQLGRAHYETYHHPDRLREALADLENPRLPEHRDLPISELLDLPTLQDRLSGEWSFLRSEFGQTFR